MKNRLLRLLDIILDAFIARIRILFYPFYLSVKAIDVARDGYLFLSNEYLKMKMGECGTGVRIYGNIKITSPENVEIGNNVHINRGAFVRAEGGLKIEDNVHIGRNLTIYTMNHNYLGQSLPYDSSLLYKPVTIKKNVWIGMNVSITPGVTIGEGAIVGMGTLVSKDVPPLAIVGGSPLNVLRYRDEQHYNYLNNQKRFSGMSGILKR